ncbi:uncharacterized protein [Apostichopus japonicus]|uniref:uncharacterized protein isoform X4 n=1 Tax=Stichopus japonicus TaxID=307972 RepID=UPI003AB80E3F
MYFCGWTITLYTELLKNNELRVAEDPPGQGDVSETPVTVCLYYSTMATVGSLSDLLSASLFLCTLLGSQRNSCAQEDPPPLPEFTVLSVHNRLEPGFELKEGANHLMQYDVAVSIDPSRTSAEIEGSDLWKISKWISQNEDGSGRKLSFEENVLIPELSSQGFLKERDSATLEFLNIIDMLTAQEGVCSDFQYFCVRFDQSDNLIPGYNLTYTMNVEGDEGVTLVDCVPLGQCYGVSAIDFEWSMIPLERPAKGCARPVELDLWVNFTENTRDLKGEGLWRVGLYGSSSIDGNGTRYAEVRQSLNALQSAERLSDARPISFSDIVTDFELGSIGCIKEYPYFCVEFAKAEGPTPDYTFITEMGDTSLISCVPQECNAGIAILELGWSRNITEVDPGDNATVVFDVRVSIDPCSPDVIGAGLWQLAMFTSETEDGSIRNIHPYISQILTAEEASTPYQGGDLLSFNGVKSHPFWTEPLGCGPLKYLCLALSKGDLPSPNYDVIFPDTKQEVIHCREEACVAQQHQVSLPTC